VHALRTLSALFELFTLTPRLKQPWARISKRLRRLKNFPLEPTQRLNNSPLQPTRRSLMLILSLDCVDFGDAFAVAIFADLGGKPGGHDLAHLGAADRFAAEREDVCVVVFA
jgi:hypothetical protein